MDELKIEMKPEDLLDLRSFLIEHSNKEINLQEITSQSAGFQREPLIIAIVVALGGPIIVKEIAGLLKEWMKIKHEEKMMKLSLLTNKGKREITLEELKKIN
jgi:hypothetical protein